MDYNILVVKILYKGYAFMGITKQECIQSLHKQFDVGWYSQIENISKLMKDSWWENKKQCLENFDNSVVYIRDTLDWWMEDKNILIWEEEVQTDVSNDWQQEQHGTNETQQPTSDDIGFFDNMSDVLPFVGKAILIFFLTLILLWLAKKL